MEGGALDIKPPMPKILFWDLETSTITIQLKTYDLKLRKDTYIDPMSIKQDWVILAAAWAFNDGPIIGMLTPRSDPYDDREIVVAISTLCNEADYAVAHNGDRFDWKKFAARCLYHDLPVPKKPHLIDTLKIARREFAVSSNSLRYLAHFLKLDVQKESKPDWEQVLCGDPAAREQMGRYNRADVRVLRSVYHRIAPHDRQHPNMNVAITGNWNRHEACPKCLSSRIESRGYLLNKKGRRPRYHCQSCGSWFSANTKR